MLDDHASSAPHTRLLSGPSGLDLRLARPTLAGWGVGIAAYGLVLGLVAKSAGSGDIELVEPHAGVLATWAIGAEAYSAWPFC